jgi:selenocysteine lyase/cysteine desulfurase
VSYKSHFRRALEADPERIHFAAHSHHLWPDVSFDAHLEAWNDAARLADRKWDKVFGEVIPRATSHIAKRLGLESGDSICFAPNTHELFMRVLSCLPHDRPLRVLTTDSEFHSFARQATRLEEDGLLQVTRIASEPHATFVERFAEAAQKPDWDLVYLSHVFFNSGYAVPDLARCFAKVAPSTLIVVDGYHAFGAIPVDIAELRDRIFYLAGGYKYAMSGEGCCFLHAPAGFGERPRDTGWFAAFGALESKTAPGQTAYAPGGARFYGATFDPSAIYRFVAVMNWLDAEKLTPSVIHAHVTKLEDRFIAELEKASLPLRANQLVVPLGEASRGQFLTFVTPDAADLHARLMKANVFTDVRGDRLRFGFAIYHDEDDITRGIARMRSALTPAA